MLESDNPSPSALHLAVYVYSVDEGLLQLIKANAVPWMMSNDLFSIFLYVFSTLTHLNSAFNGRLCFPTSEVLGNASLRTEMRCEFSDNALRDCLLNVSESMDNTHPMDHGDMGFYVLSFDSQ